MASFVAAGSALFTTHFAHTGKDDNNFSQGILHLAIITTQFLLLWFFKNGIGNNGQFELQNGLKALHCFLFKMYSFN